MNSSPGSRVACRPIVVKTNTILYKPRLERASSLAQEIVEWLRERGRRPEVHAITARPHEIFHRPIDLLVTLGGDGSILRAARCAAPHSALLLGINLGRVGFLTETEPETWRETLSALLIDDYWVEERMMLRAMIRCNGNPVKQADALNDVVVGRGARAQVVHLSTKVDGGDLATYVSDGLIVATPTGSTAYALAAGGPIMPPQLRNILLVPVAPHLSIGRPIVLSEGATVHIVVESGRSAVLTVDGEVCADLQSGDEITVEASPHTARFARVRERTYFYKTLLERLTPRQ